MGNKTPINKVPGIKLPNIKTIITQEMWESNQLMVLLPMMMVADQDHPETHTKAFTAQLVPDQLPTNQIMTIITMVIS